MRHGPDERDNNAAFMRIIPAIAAFAMALGTHAQGPVRLSLQQAMDQAAKQSYSVQYSVLEAEKADAKTKEVLGVGLPQISATGGLNNYLKVPTQLIPNPFGNEPQLLEFEFGIPWTLTGAVQLTQLLFDGSYLVGLKAARAVRDKSQLDLQKAEHDARAQAAKAYYAVLAAEQGVRLLGEGLPLLEKSTSDARAMVEQGFMESTDVDRLTIQLADTRNQQRNMQQQANVARAYLALVLGLPVGTPVQLADSLGELMNDPAEQALAKTQATSGQHIDEKIATSTLGLAVLEERHQKAAYLPTLAGFINYQEQYNGLELKPSAGPWFPSSLWGISLNVPLFSSGMRHQRVQQAKLAIKQAEVNRLATEQRVHTELLQQQALLAAAEDSYNTAKDNMDLARRIFQRTTAKFEVGMGSSFELTQEHANYLAAQQNYIQRTVDLLQARTEMRKALDLY